MIFPQYRKYPNNLVYFKITSEQQFEELQIVGKKVIKNNITANTLPERNFISDMLSLKKNWVAITEDEYEKIALQKD